GLGWGPAAGNTAVLRATGLGSGSFQLFVGDHAATIVVRHGQTGVDEIAFRLPRDTPEGCYIPVYAQTADGLVSNVVTLPLPRGRTLCKAPEAWPRPAARIGTLVLSRFSIWFDAEPG